MDPPVSRLVSSITVSGQTPQFHLNIDQLPIIKISKWET